MKKRKVLGFSLVAAGLFLFVLNPVANLTGFAIAENIASAAGSWLYVFGLALMLTGCILFITNPNLEKRLFYTDSRGIVRITDPLGEFIREGISYRELKASEVIKMLRDLWGKTEEDKQLARESILKDYILWARAQRDSSTAFPIPRGSETEMADNFLRDWDPQYQPVVHPLLRERTYDANLNPTSGVYDTRDIIKVMQENVPGFKLDEKEIPNHDVPVSYYGERFLILGGTQNPYETDKSQINNAIVRIAKSDIKRKTLLPGDLDKRIKVLKIAIFGED